MVTRTAVYTSFFEVQNFKRFLPQTFRLQWATVRFFEKKLWIS